MGAQLWNSQTGTIVLGNEINCFPLHIKFKVHGSSIMEFPDWVQVKEKHYRDLKDVYRRQKLRTDFFQTF